MGPAEAIRIEPRGRDGLAHDEPEGFDDGATRRIGVDELAVVGDAQDRMRVRPRKVLGLRVRR